VWLAPTIARPPTRWSAQSKPPSASQALANAKRQTRDSDRAAGDEFTAVVGGWVQVVVSVVRAWRVEDSLREMRTGGPRESVQIQTSQSRMREAGASRLMP
jgi:hypothetical protein